MSGVLEGIKTRPRIEELRSKETKEQRDARIKKVEEAEIKKLSQVLSERDGKPKLREIYIDSFDCKFYYGDPSLNEVLEILKESRESNDMNSFVFNLLHLMLKKGDPELTPDSLSQKMDAFEALDLLAEMIDVSPFFKKVFSLRSSGKFSLV